MAFRGEAGVGEWKAIVRDTNDNEHNGTFTDWRITLWGESIDGSKQGTLPMPTDHDDDDHDRVIAVVSTTTLAPISTQTELPSQPTDHIDRPVNEKPSSVSTSATATAISPTSTSATDTSTTATPSSFLPSIFPTFGVSPRTQIWIYGAATVIVLFCIALGVFFFVWRRRRARTTGPDYEFEMLDDQDAGAGAPLSGGKRRTKRRGGELYDAFAGESDEEIFSEGEEGEYKDEEPSREKSAVSPDRGLSEK